MIPPKQAGVSKFLIIIIIVGVLVIAGVVWYYQKTIQIISQPTTQISPVNQTAGWQTYTNTQYGFEVKYPSILKLSESLDGRITLEHSVPWVHKNPDDMSYNAPKMLDRLTDFRVSIELLNKNIRETFLKNNPNMDSFIVENGLKIMPGYIERIGIGTLSGYIKKNYFEGMGFFDYYFILNETKTLNVIRLYVSEFTGTDRDVALNIKDVISPDKEEKIFNQILSTFKFIEPSSTANNRCSAEHVISCLVNTGIKEVNKIKENIPCSNDNDCQIQNIKNFCSPGFPSILNCVGEKYYCSGEYCKNCYDLCSNGGINNTSPSPPPNE